MSRSLGVKAVAFELERAFRNTQAERRSVDQQDGTMEPPLVTIMGSIHWSESKFNQFCVEELLYQIENWVCDFMTEYCRVPRIC